MILINSANRLSLFLGKPVVFNQVSVFSPTVEKIENIGEIEYSIKYLLSSFEKDKILSLLLKMTEDELETLVEADDYEVLTDDLRIANLISEAISFFTDKPVMFNYRKGIFEVLVNENETAEFLNKENYKEFVEIIHTVNGVISKKNKKVKYKNKRAEKMARELEKMRSLNNKNKDDGLELKDLLSILCSDAGNGITVFNVHNLTLYQVTEQFERLGIKYNRDTMLPVWANGYMKEGSKLPELLVKTKF